jgi:hypothetical protein
MNIDVVDTYRQPEYTGENRCEPCTVLNLVIAMMLSSVVARKSKFGGAVVFGISVGLIYLRGYFVPGTPKLTKRYLPPEILRWFGKDPEPELASGFVGSETVSLPSSSNSSQSSAQNTPSTTDESTDCEIDTTEYEFNSAEEELETFFLNHDILKSGADLDDLYLTNDFEERWSKMMEQLVDSEITAEMVVDTFRIKTDGDQNLELVDQDEVQILQSESALIGQWPSRAALIADIAASNVLQSWVPAWNDFDPKERGSILNGLRMFLETCPTTGGNIQLGEEVIESCCSSHKVIAVTCKDTGERLFEHQVHDTEF